MQNSINKNFVLSLIGLGLICYYCILASIFSSIFAKTHLTLQFLPFPIFISEIFLFICLALFFGLGKSFSRRTSLLLGLYFGWVLAKASINFYFDGPLTGRNAALFYYPIFAVFAYCFYRNVKISSNILKFLVFIPVCVLFSRAMLFYYWWTYVLLFIISMWNTKSQLRWIGWIFLAGILLSGAEYFYQGSRSNFVSILGSMSFLLLYFGAMFIKRKQVVLFSILVFVFIMFITGFFIFSNRHTVSSLTSLKGMLDTYKTIDSSYRIQEPSFVPRTLPVQLYHPIESKPFLLHKDVEAMKVKTASSSLAPVYVKDVSSLGLINIVNRGIFNRNINEDRPLGVDEDNIVFRLFVWRDMAHELIEKRAWWGFSFGKPQRSKSLEVLHWAQGEWSRDGWITPHNSFFHIIYRAGILGVFLIGVLFFMVYGLIRDFFNNNSVEGALLVAILIYWLVLSNFLVILEFPYNAILFWSLFGITCAYRDGLQRPLNNSKAGL
jgi:hypothetical protein